MVCEACKAMPPPFSCPVCKGNTKVDEAIRSGSMDPVSAGSSTAPPPHTSDGAGPKHSVDDEVGGDAGMTEREAPCSVCHDLPLKENWKCNGCGREGPSADA